MVIPRLATYAEHCWTPVRNSLRSCRRCWYDKTLEAYAGITTAGSCIAPCSWRTLKTSENAVIPKWATTHSHFSSWTPEKRSSNMQTPCEGRIILPFIVFENSSPSSPCWRDHITGRCYSGEKREAEIIVSPVRLSWPGELKTVIMVQAFKNIVYSW